MIDAVDITLKHWRQSAFVYGQTDCLMSVNDHAVSVGARDVASAFRGVYSDQAGAEWLLMVLGGHGPIIALSGARQITNDDMDRGDIVVMSITGSDSVLAGIATSSATAATRREDRGVIELPLRLITISQVWRL